MCSNSKTPKENSGEDPFVTGLVAIFIVFMLALIGLGIFSVFVKPAQSAENLILEHLDSNDAERALKAAAFSLVMLEIGTQTIWINPDNGNSGSATILDNGTDQNGNLCRRLRIVVNSGPNMGFEDYSACVSETSTWTINQKWLLNTINLPYINESCRRLRIDYRLDHGWFNLEQTFCKISDTQWSVDGWF